ncbi:MAG: RNA polymerase subunit sigma-70 [Acidobacteria bacterium]|nr:MAG: RNA polymerase subunit sigma-70 [Acidobacteriota bacterium]
MPPEVTQLLLRLRAGEHGALDELMPIMYVELRRIARAYMSRQRAGHTLQPTALVNEAYIKLFGDLEPQLADRAHFVALMSRVMRQVLVDHARSSGAAKRGGADGRVPLDTNIEIGDDRGSEQLNLLDLHRALEALERENAPLAHVVEMHYFGGMTAEEVAASRNKPDLFPGRDSSRGSPKGN